MKYKIYALVTDIIRYIKYFFIELFCSNTIVINFWLPPVVKIGRYNYGDDINLILVEQISRKKVIPYKYSILSRFNNKSNYLCIGSIISQLTNPKTEIWGSGVLSPDIPMNAKPRKVWSVRGALSRDYLLKQGIDCPEVYGDPALLLPLYYKPASETRKYRIGIIPHYKDKNNPVLKQYAQNKDILIIDVQNYGHWHSFLDRICSCDFIISSSLHGLIISDTYQVPNLWVEFSDEVQGNGFKFRDYFSSVGRTIESPRSLRKFIPVDEIIRLKSGWTPVRVDYQKLLDACPFYKKCD